MSLTNLNFKIHIAKMLESHRETFWLIVSHPDYISSGKLGSEKGTMTPFMSEDIDKTRFMAHKYAALFGMSYDQVKDDFIDEYPEKNSAKRIRYSLIERILTPTKEKE